MSGYEGRFFDGQSSRPRPVWAELSADGTMLTITSRNAVERTDLARWPVDCLVPADEPKDPDRIVLASTTARDARLTLEGMGVRAWLVTLAPQLSDKGRRRTGYWLPLRIAAVTAVLVVLTIVGLPRLAARYAEVIPAEWFAATGDKLVQGASAAVGTCDAQAGHDALRALLRQLHSDPDAPLPTLTVLDDGLVNAFATFGNNIVLFRGLIEAAESSDELAGVMAHELGHLEHLHLRRQVIQQVGLSLLVAAFAGADFEQIITALAGSAYSRGAEAEADRFAIDALKRAQISPHGFSRFFARLAPDAADDRPKGGLDRLSQALNNSFVSSHPPSKEREALALAAIGTSRDYRPAMSGAPWAAVKAVCDETTAPWRWRSGD